MSKLRRAYKRRLNWQLTRYRKLRRAMATLRQAQIAAAAYCQLQLIAAAPSASPVDTLRKVTAIAALVARTAKAIGAVQVR